MRRTLNGHHSSLNLNPNLKKTVCILAVGMLVSFMSAGVGLAQPTTFLGTAGPLWSTPANWSAGLPHGGSTVLFSPLVGPSTMDVGGLTIAQMDMSGYLGTLTIEQDLWVSGDVVAQSTVLLANGAPLNVTGNMWITGGSFDTGVGALITGGYLDIAGTLTGGGLVIASGGITGVGALNGPLIVTAPNVALNLASMSLVSMSGGTVNLDSGILSLPADATLGSVTSVGGSDISTTGGAASIGGSLDVDAGTLDISGADLNVSGATTISPGATLQCSGSVGRQYSFGADVWVFGTLHISTPLGTVYFQTGSTVYVDPSGTLQLQGAPGSEMTILGMAGPSPQWLLDIVPGETVSISTAIIMDGNCPSGLRVPGCINGGGNTGFIFPGERELEVSVLTAPPVWTDAGAAIPISYTVYSAGDTVLTSFRAAVRVVTDTLAVPTGAPVQTITIPGMNPLDSFSTSFFVVLPPGTPRGDVYIAATADDLDEVNEIDDSNNSRFSALSYQVPEFHSVRDIPGDQGGEVYVSWYAAPPDLPAGGGLITFYSIWRAIDPLGVQAMLDKGATLVRPGEPLPRSSGNVIRVQEAAGQTFFWHPIDTTGAYHLSGYGYAEPTLFDSTATSGENTYYQVIAHTSDELVFYISGPDSGYSVDNLAPAAPQNLAGDQVSGAGGLLLTWDPNIEMDLSHYAIYRGASAGFIPGPGNLLSESPDTFQTDGAWLWDSGDHYKVAAVDVHGNESVFAVLGPGLATGIDPARTPAASFLSQNYPNPFSQGTGIPFGLSREENVTIRIYDVRGRLVRTLLSERRKASAHAVSWDGRDARGTLVAAGIYFYRLEAGAFVQAKKMVVVR